MIREICKAEVFLAQKAEAATADDLNTAQDLLDTLIAHKDGCVGMAANMIGVNKRIIAFENDGEYMLMFNPVIVKKSGPYDTEEGCLSLTGTRKAKRFQTVKVQWQNEKFQTRLKTFTGWTAEIIQHEIDHCEGCVSGAFPPQRRKISSRSQPSPSRCSPWSVSWALRCSCAKIAHFRSRLRANTFTVRACCSQRPATACAPRRRRSPRARRRI